MPSPTTTKWPKPRSEDEFEDIALDALRLCWNDPSARRHGRRGQRQHGVDIHGRHPRVPGPIGAQCKNTDELTASAIAVEVNKAETFSPRLREFVFVTSMVRDAKLDRDVRELSARRELEGKFPVQIMFWEDVCHELARNPELVRQHWPGWPEQPVASPTEVLAEFVSLVMDPSEVEIWGPYYWPHLNVLQRDEHSDRQAYEWCRIRIYAPGLQRAPLEPEDEDSFLAAVHSTFPDDPVACICRADGDSVLVENRPEDLSYHRTWGYWTLGAIGFACTLLDPKHPTSYSVPDLVHDFVMFMRLASGLPGVGPCRIVFEHDPNRLVPSWHPGDARAQVRLAAPFAGVQSPGASSTLRCTKWALERDGELGNLSSDAPGLAAELIAQAVRKLHGTRVNSKQFANEVPQLLRRIEDARMH